MYQLKKNAKALTPQKIKKELLNYLKKIDYILFDLNIKQLEKGTTPKGGILNNKNKKYSGFYTQTTELIAKQENPLAPKKEGQPYNFLYSGDFVKGFISYIKGESIEWLSTGTGSGTKKEFFDGYKEFFGLDDESKRIVINDYLKKTYLIFVRIMLLK